jgi:hypothetical protein
MLELVTKTTVGPTTITFEDLLPEGIEFDGEVTAWDHKGRSIGYYNDGSGKYGQTAYTTGTASANLKALNANLIEDLGQLNTVTKLPALSISAESVTKNGKDRTRIYTELKDDGMSLLNNATVAAVLKSDPGTKVNANQFTFRIRVRIKENYRNTLNVYNNTAKVTFAYSAIGENPFSNVSNRVQVATRPNDHKFEFTKYSAYGDGQTALGGMTFQMKYLGRSKDAPVRTVNEYGEIQFTSASKVATDDNGETNLPYNVPGSGTYTTSAKGEVEISAKLAPGSKLSPKWYGLVEQTPQTANDGVFDAKVIEFGVYRENGNIYYIGTKGNILRVVDAPDINSSLTADKLSIVAN